MYGDDLRTLRSRVGLTQQRLASCLGLSVSAVQKWEAGARPKGAAVVLFEILADAVAASGESRVARALDLAGNDPVEAVKELARLAS